MCNLSDFLAANPRSRKLGSFKQEDCLLLGKQKIPSDIVGFLQTEGICTYRDDFLWTALPLDHFQTLSAWGLPGEQCFVFMRTSLGGLIFWRRDKIFQLNPFTGNVIENDLNFCEFMNLWLTTDAAMESDYFDVFQRGKRGRLLENDEIFALVPALSLGGSLETSGLEVVKIREHLAFLAQLFNNNAKII